MSEEEEEIKTYKSLYDFSETINESYRYNVTRDVNIFIILFLEQLAFMGYDVLVGDIKAKKKDTTIILIENTQKHCIVNFYELEYKSLNENLTTPILTYIFWTYSIGK